MRVALFATCLVDALFPQVGQATVRPAGAARPRGRRSRRRRPAAGRCTSTPATGARRVPLVANHVRGASPDCEAIVRRPARASARSATSTPPSPRRAGERRAGRRAEAAGRAHLRAVASSWSTSSASTDVGAYYPHRVTYHPTCHSLRLLRVGDRPLRLLRAVRGLDLVELPGADECCGFGGTFAVKNADTSTAMLTDKMRNVLATGAEVVHRRRLVLPDAHRRRAVPAARRHPHGAPGRDPRRAVSTGRAGAR